MGDVRFKKKTIPVISLSILLSAFWLAFMSPEEIYIAAPGLACFNLVLWLWMTSWDRDQKIPFFDVAMLCALATLLYTVFPLLNYWLDGMQFGVFSDARLQASDIKPFELGFFHCRHVVYLFSFVVFYVMFRGKGTIITGNVCDPSRSARLAIITLFILLTAASFFFQLTTRINFDYSYESEAFENSVSAISAMPLILLQISGKILGILFVFKLGVLVIVVRRCGQKKWLLILFVWIAVEIVQTFIIKGSRTGLILFLMSAALLYHRMIKPLTMKFLFSSGTVLLVAFIFFGLYRFYFDFASFRSDISLSTAGIFSGSNEFQTLLGTAYDVFQKKEAGVYFPWYLYLNDIITILPPQQLMPFEKVAASEWYLREIGISGTGQGLMWGVVSQSIIGLDWVELAFRGAMLGFILACFHRWYLKHQTGFLETLFYMYFCIKVYYTFRDTTFSFLTNLIWEIIPFYILLQLGVALINSIEGNRSIRASSMLNHGSIN